MRHRLSLRFCSGPEALDFDGRWSDDLRLADRVALRLNTSVEHFDAAEVREGMWSKRSTTAAEYDLVVSTARCPYRYTPMQNRKEVRCERVGVSYARRAHSDVFLLDRRRVRDGDVPAACGSTDGLVCVAGLEAGVVESFLRAARRVRVGVASPSERGVFNSDLEVFFLLEG